MKCNALQCNAMQCNARMDEVLIWMPPRKKGFIININFSEDSAEGLKVVWGWIAENFPQNNFKAVTHNLQNLPFSAFKLSS